jgi:hypothetical protein
MERLRKTMEIFKSKRVVDGIRRGRLQNGSQKVTTWVNSLGMLVEFGESTSWMEVRKLPPEWTRSVCWLNSQRAHPEWKSESYHLSELYLPSDRRLSAKLVPTFADRGCYVVSVTDPYGRILEFLDRLNCLMKPFRCSEAWTVQESSCVNKALPTRDRYSGGPLW